MKVLIISDAHGSTENIEKLSTRFQDSDLVLFGGDFAKFNHPQTARPALKAMTESSTPVFAVLGNCDEPEFISEIEESVR